LFWEKEEEVGEKREEVGGKREEVGGKREEVGGKREEVGGKREEGREEGIEIKSVEYEVPFTPQAPFGDWEDERQQEGCEEASVLMTVYWARDLELTPELAKEKILDMADHQKDDYGTFVDTHVDDTAERLLKDYFDHSAYQVKKDIDIDDIKEALMAGNLVIVPLNGREVGNPYYTPPGPDRHNLVITGYDHESGEFITNDPGTRRGEEFRYKTDVLLDSIRDYPTGKEVPIQKQEKNMIVVGK
jgi:hypothetical protein